MEEYILDTNILIYLLEGRGPVLRSLRRLRREFFYTSVISHFEFLIGAANQSEETKIRIRLKEMAPLPVSLNIVERAVDLSKSHRKKFKFKDLLIAATAEVEGLTLVTADKDFKKIKDLKTKYLQI